MHHGQSRGKRKTHKVCKKHVNFTKSGREIWKISGMKNSRNRGEIIKIAKIAKIPNFWSMTKNKKKKFWRMKIEKLVLKVKLEKFSTESEIFSEIRGKSETG